MLIWVTGISGTGKSTIASKLYEKIKPAIPNLVLFDGDEFRAALGSDLGYSLKDRDTNATRLTGICRLLCQQGIHVICAANLTSQRFRDLCRKEIPGYFEIYLDVHMSVLAQRDKKGLYAVAQMGKESQVVGVDIPFRSPRSPDMIIDNSTHRVNFDEIVDLIIQKSGVRKYFDRSGGS